MSPFSLKCLLLLVSAVAVTQCVLQVYMPECASKQFEEPIKYTLANFGHIPYGRTIVGEIMIPKNEIFCETDDNTQYFNTKQSGDVKRFALIRRGQCKFTKKILNAQARGADFVIVYDNDKSVAPNVVMSNDGHGHLISIPSVLISNSDGLKLIKAVQSCESAILKIQFDVFTSKIVNLTFWLDVNNRESYISIRQFYHDYYPVLKNHLKLDIKFKIDNHCGRVVCLPDDCIKNKQQYCLHSDKVIAGVPIAGKQLIGQHLRSYFLFHTLRDKNQIDNWFNYMIEFDESVCMEKVDIRDCSLGIIKKYESIDYIQGLVKQTYDNATNNNPNVLAKLVNDSFNHDILFYPEASINSKNYYGLFRAPDIFEMICESLESPPKQCHSFTITDGKQIFGKDSTGGLWKTILLIIACTILLFFAALFIYNRLIRREMNQQMSMEVNKMVEHYVAMTQQKSRSNASM